MNSQYIDAIHIKNSTPIKIMTMIYVLSALFLAIPLQSNAKESNASAVSIQIPLEFDENGKCISGDACIPKITTVYNDPPGVDN